MSTLNDQKIRDGLSVVLLAVTAVLAVMLLAKLVTSGTGAIAEAGNSNLNTPDDPCQTDEKKLTQRQELAQALRKVDMFNPPPPKPQPPNQIQAIFGDQAWVNGKWYGVGDTIPPGAKVIEINPTYITIEWEGQKKKQMAPIKAAGAVSGSSDGPRGGRPERMGRERGKMDRGGRGGRIQRPPSVTVRSNDDLGWLNVPGPLKERLRGKWNELTPEQKTDAKARWERMGDSEREQALKEIAREL